MAIFTWRVYDTVVGAHFEVESLTRPTDRDGNAIDDNRTVILCDDRSCSPVNRIETTFKKDSQPYMLVDQTVFTTVGEIIFPGTDAWTPTLVRAIMACQIAGLTDFCAAGTGKPEQIRLRYTGEDCTATSHSQDAGKVSCSGDPASADPVRIVVNDKSAWDAATQITHFDGTVNLGDTFTAGTVGVDVKNTTYVHVLSIPGDTVLQTVSFHTSCSQLLIEGDQYGSIVLVGVLGNGIDLLEGSKYGFRLFDLTNGNVVAEILDGGTLFTLGAVEEIIRTMTLFSLPAGEAIFEIQVLKSTSAAADGKIFHVTLEE